MRKFWQHVLGKPYLLYDDKKGTNESKNEGTDPNEQNLNEALGMSNHDLANSSSVIIPLVTKKEHFHECTTLEQKIEWAQSPEGQVIIQGRPLLKHYYETGYLFKLFNNPFWEVRLKEWLSPPNEKSMTQVPYGLTLPQTEEEIELNRKSWLHPPHQNPPLPLLYEDYYQQFYYYTIPIENKLELYTKGYTVLHNIIPKELIQAAIEKINDHILQTDLYFDVLHNEKYYSNSSSKKEKEKQKQQQHQQMMMKKKQGTFAENPFIGNPEKQKIRLENRKLQRDEDPYFISGTSNDLAILSLYYATPVHAMVESLLHGNPSKYSEQVLLKQPSAAPAKQASSLKHSDEIRRPFRIATGGGQIAYRFTQPINHQARSETLLTMRMSHSAKNPPLATEEQKDKSKKASASFYNTLKSNDPILNKRYPPIGGNSWHIDGLGRGQWGTFSFLIGVPLNDQFDEYSGNLCLHDGSHYLLQSYLKQYANRFNAADSFEEKYRLAKDIEKPNLGEPTQILASAGDVIIALHKVAHLGGPNYGTEVRKMVYFRVSHQRHQELRFNALDDLWIEYEGMDDVLPK